MNEIDTSFMRKQPILLALSLLACLALSSPLLAQCTLPADSPVLSNGVDDLPPTNDSIYTYPAGTTATGRANHRIAFAQIGPNEQRVYFAVDGGTIGVAGGTYYNRRYRADANSPWYWQFSRSPLICPTLHFGFPGVVLYSPTPKFGIGNSDPLRKYVLMGAEQPAACDGIGGAGGFLTISFSDDGITWTTPYTVQNTALGAPSFSCDPDAGVPVTAELVTAFDLGYNGVIAIITMSGDNAYLASGPWDTPQAYLWTTSAAYMAVAQPWGYGQNPTQLSQWGLFMPYGTGSGCWPMRTQTYGYMFNIDGAYDAAAGDIYISRGYPFPFDRDYQGFTCQWVGPATPGPTQRVDTIYNGYSIEGCGPSPATLPNRVQLYKMHIGALSNISAILSGTWTLVGDWGGSVGYENIFYGGNQPLIAGQTNVGYDWGSLQLLRDSVGNMLFNGNQYTVLGGDTVKKSKAVGPCRVTGLERITPMTLTK